MLKIKKGYTLAEVMVVITLLGILASILLPTISKLRPNRDMMMFKKAYLTTERIVYELVNDDELYTSKDGTYYGLDNTEPATFGGYTYGSNTDDNAKKAKFCGLFARKVNTTRDVTGSETFTAADDIVGCKTSAVPTTAGTFTKPNFYTTDGIAWYIPISLFPKTSDNKPGSGAIYVDVNGEKQPNCIQSTTCIKPDIFKINVKADGKMFIDSADTISIDYLKKNNSVR